MRFTLAYDPYATEHRDAAKRRDEIREWMARRENGAESLQLVHESQSGDHALHKAA